MAKTVLITTDNEISVVDVPWTLDGWYKAIGGGCDIVETVKTQYMFDLFKMPVAMIVDEEGHCRGQELNLAASILYGMSKHGYPIPGNVIFAIPNGPELDPPASPETLMKILVDKFGFLKEADHVDVRV